jgi:quercetin dioxygenase-like cupin family protein
MPFINLPDLPAHELLPGYKARFIHTAHNSYVYWTAQAGSSFPEHSHPHEQVAHVLSGAFELIVGGEKRTLSPGIVAVIPPDVKHSGTALTDCELLDVFYPVREDYRK